MLREVRIDHAFALDALENIGPPLFPQLTFLEVRGATLEVDGKPLGDIAHNVFRVVSYHAPKLVALHFMQQPSLNTAVEELLKASMATA